MNLSPTFGLYGDEPTRLIEESARARIVGLADRVSRDSAVLRALRTADALIVGTQRIGYDELIRAPRLRIIAKHGSGIDNIDVAAATALGIAVTSALGTNALAVAELTLAMILVCARGILAVDQSIRHGEWRAVVGAQVSGGTLGLIGMGQVGKLVAARAAAIGMRVIGSDPHVLPGGPRARWTAVSLEHVLAESDYLSVHVPLLPSTLHLIDEQALRSMKRSGYLINTSRGGVVEEAALARALDQGWIAGAALDVFEVEPLSPMNPLALSGRTVLTSHMGGYTQAAIAATSRATAESVVDALAGRWPRRSVNRVRTWRGAGT